MGADYAGLMDGDVCGCGSEAGYIEADKEDGECLVECAGDDGRTEICGGETSFVLIQIIYSGMAIVTNGAYTLSQHMHAYACMYATTLVKECFPKLSTVYRTIYQSEKKSVEVAQGGDAIVF